MLGEISLTNDILKASLTHTLDWGLLSLVRSSPDTLRYENAVSVADGDYVSWHGRCSGSGQPAASIAADIVRMEYGRLAEHWDVLQDEATEAQSKSGLPMFAIA